LAIRDKSSLDSSFISDAQLDIRGDHDMNRRRFARQCLGTAGIWSAAQGLQAQLRRPEANANRPNIVFILADDLGYGDLSCYGAEKVQTPIIDNLARQGVLFTDAHAPAAVCTPSRYGVLTGRYCWRTQLKVDCLFGHDPLLIEEDRMTVASMLKSVGYTTACIGKWHLGFGKDYPEWNGELKPGPLEVGFDSYFGYPVTNAQAPYVYIENHRVVGLDPRDPIRLGPESKTNVMYGGTAARYKADELSMTVTQKAVKFIEGNKHPFFLYFTPPNVHGPYTPNARFRGTSSCGVYCDFIRELDWSVGEVLAAIDRAGIADNTLVIVTSDNGGLYSRPAYDMGHRVNGDLLGQKTDAWEGGHRVPFIGRWPKRIKAGSRSDELICLVDFMATVAAIHGIELPRNAAPDSFNVLPALLGEHKDGPVRGAPVILASESGMLAVRDGNWLFVLGRGSGGSTTEYARHYGMRLEELGRKTTGWKMADLGRPDPSLPPGQLYNLAKDRGQAENVYGNHPEVVKRLTDLVIDYRARGRSRP
jgi:arylsulfatase A-like enzyme